MAIPRLTHKQTYTHTKKKSYTHTHIPPPPPPPYPVRTRVWCIHYASVTNDITRAQGTTETPKEPSAVQYSQKWPPHREFEKQEKDIQDTDRHVKTIQTAGGNLGFSDIHYFGLSPSGKKTLDDHHSKISPEDYLVLRLNKAVEFYKHRLSRNQIKKFVSTFLLMAASALWILFSVTDRAGLIAVCAVFSVAVTSWMRTGDIECNLVRYRTCLDRLQYLRDEFVNKNIEFDNLVQNVEEVISQI